MSDIPLRDFNLPHIDDNLLWKILVRAEPKENYTANKHRTRSLIIGMGYPPTDHVSHYFVRYDVDRNEQLTIVVPHSIWRYYNHVVLGSDHGVICIRSSAGGGRSRILLWNPLTRKDQLLPDDPHGHCCFSTSVYGFGYLGDSMENMIVHIFKCDHTEQKFSWSLYDSLGKGWNNKGRMTWFDTEIPERAKTTYHALLDYNNGVGFISYLNVGFRRSIQVWQLVQQDVHGINWVKMINVRGLGIPLIPTVFVGNDIISVLECKGGFATANDTHRTEIWITILKHNTTSIRQLLHNSWQEELCLKTITMHTESLYDLRA
ncbi:hypothetical protein PIB30_013386 [Stylosanthes scabra]|uniref:F-box associated domain-containing protein n=1 Tax=Stylosanthes scabra TaxID=79078 RepID=A0ABU6W9H1_9FABA|nr:hypothetical protein [Stylosanthes scabra]